ncbi:MAG TPA: hypothetical protein VKB57_13630, partial [Acidimicrobiales bacterium]|nr:hypothetical protein [Acidimicrobiales bacterium]
HRGGPSAMRRAYGLLLDIERFAGVRLGPGPLYGAIGRREERGLIEPVRGRCSSAGRCSS